MTGRQPSRAVDRLIAALGLLILSPLLGLAALAVRLTSTGSPLYRAPRVGLGGRTFTMYKLRTMRQGSEQTGGPITAGSDPRVLPVGRVLRKTKIDEVLQLVNVVIGDMALVGPRPEAPEIVHRHYTPTMKQTLAVLPGVTSPGTLHYMAHDEASIPPGPDGQRYYVDQLLPRKLALDLVYVRSRSLFYDIAILLRTAVAIVGSNRGDARRSSKERGKAVIIEDEIRQELGQSFRGHL